MARRKAVVINDFAGQRRVHLTPDTRVPVEPQPMAEALADGTVRDAKGKVVARDPGLTRWDRSSRTHVAYVERDSGPASVQAYRPVVDLDGKDEAGRAARFQRRSTGIEYLHRAGDITDAQIEAVRWLAERIETAQLGAAIQAVDWGRVGGASFDPAKAMSPMGGDLSVSARRQVREALKALNWPDSLPARLLVYTISTGQGVIGWQVSQGCDKAKRKHRQYLVGCLVGAVVQLEMWYRGRD